MVRSKGTNGSVILPNDSVIDTEWFGSADRMLRFFISNGSVRNAERFGRSDRRLRSFESSGSIRGMEPFGQVNQKVRSDGTNGPVILPNNSVRNTELFDMGDRTVRSGESNCSIGDR